MVLTKKYRSLISDIIFNQDFDVDLIEDVIQCLYKDNCIEYDRCDKTIDLFAGA